MKFEKAVNVKYEKVAQFYMRKVDNGTKLSFDLDNGKTVDASSIIFGRFGDAEVTGKAYKTTYVDSNTEKPIILVQFTIKPGVGRYQIECSGALNPMKKKHEKSPDLYGAVDSKMVGTSKKGNPVSKTISELMYLSAWIEDQNGKPVANCSLSRKIKEDDAAADPAFGNPTDTQVISNDDIFKGVVMGLAQQAKGGSKEKPTPSQFKPKDDGKVSEAGFGKLQDPPDAESRAYAW